MAACVSGAQCSPHIEEYKGTNETCGSTYFAYPYFLSFVFLTSFLLLNLFVAVVIDNFAYLSRDESVLGTHHLDDFRQAWAEFDPRGRGYIKHYEAAELLKMIPAPLGVGRNCPKHMVYKRLVQMNMLLKEDGTVGFTATFFHLCRTSFKLYTENSNLRSNDKEMRAMLKRVWPFISPQTINTVLPKRKGVLLKKTLCRLYTVKLIYLNYKSLRAATGRMASDFADGINQIDKIPSCQGCSGVESIPLLNTNGNLEENPFRSLSRWSPRLVRNPSMLSLRYSEVSGITTTVSKRHRRQATQNDEHCDNSDDEEFVVL